MLSGSCAENILSFGRNRQAVFQGGGGTVRAHLQGAGFPLLPALAGTGRCQRAGFDCAVACAVTSRCGLSSHLMTCGRGVFSCVFLPPVCLVSCLVSSPPAVPTGLASAPLGVFPRRRVQSVQRQLCCLRGPPEVQRIASSPGPSPFLLRSRDLSVAATLQHTERVGPAQP